jgi:hypothetical protein
MEQQHGRTFSGAISRVTGQVDAAFVGVDAELFRRCGASGAAQRKQREARQHGSAIDHGHDESGMADKDGCRLTALFKPAGDIPLKSLVSESGPNPKIAQLS